VMFKGRLGGQMGRDEVVGIDDGLEVGKVDDDYQPSLQPLYLVEKRALKEKEKEMMVC
jgi:hypothetical protein